MKARAPHAAGRVADRDYVAEPGRGASPQRGVCGCASAGPGPHKHSVGNLRPAHYTGHEDPMTQSDPLVELLRAQKEDAEKKAPDWGRRREEWVSEVKSLMDQLAAWLEPAEEEGLLRVERRTVELNEEHLGRYDAAALDVVTLVPGSRSVQIRPVAALIVGGRGRVDLSCAAKRYKLVLVEPRTWTFVEIEGHRWVAEPLAGKSFSAIMGRLIQ